MNLYHFFFATITYNNLLPIPYEISIREVISTTQVHGKSLYNVLMVTVAKKNDTNVCMHITSKRIELESPGWSGLVRF